MTTTANMSLVLPTPGGDSGTWDDLLNAALTLVDSHDHTTGKGPRIPSSALNVNANVSLGGYSLTSVGTLDFAESTIASGARRLFFSAADHELYVRTNGGTNVKITSGAALNISIVGGIVGDYSSVGAEVAYNDANDRYTFKQETGAGAVKQWATRAGGNVDIYEQLATASATTISNRVRLSSPAALAASYAMTFPAALPGSTSLLQVSSAGAIAANATGARCAAFFTTLDCNSTVTLGTAVGAFTATAAVTATDFKHTTVRIKQIPASAGIVTGGGSAAFLATGVMIDLGTHTGGSTTPTCVIPITLDQGMRITKVRILMVNNSAVAPVGRLKSYHQSSGTTTSIANATISANEINLNSLTTTVASSTHYWAQVEGAGAAGTGLDFVTGIEVSYDRP